jgi:hypothetical protein
LRIFSRPACKECLSFFGKEVSRDARWNLRTKLGFVGRNTTQLFVRLAVSNSYKGGLEKSVRGAIREAPVRAARTRRDSANIGKDCLAGVAKIDH